MLTYGVAGVVIRTDIELPELPRVDGAPVDWTVTGATTRPEVTVDALFEIRTPDDALWATLGSGDGTYQLRWEDQVEFFVDVASRTVTFVPAPGVADSTLRHLLVDQVVPHLLAIDGALVLHASAVAIDGQAVAFVGPSGTGKSSLAGAHVQAGATLLTDDYLLLEEGDDGRYVATAAYPGLRLWPDSAEFLAGTADELPTVAGYTSKRRWEAPGEHGFRARHPLRALVALGNEPAPGAPDCRIGPARGADAFLTLYQQAFRMERSGRASQQADLDRFIRLAEQVPMLVIEYRRQYDRLPEVLATIRAALAELDG